MSSYLRHKRTFDSWLIFLNELNKNSRGEWWVNTRPDDLKEKDKRFINFLNRINIQFERNPFSDSILSLYFVDMMEIGSELVSIPPRAPMTPPMKNYSAEEYEMMCFELANNLGCEYGYYALDYCFPQKIIDWSLWEIFHLRKNMMFDINYQDLLIYTRKIICLVLSNYRELIRPAFFDPFTHEPLLSDLNAFEWKDYVDIWYFPSEANKRLPKELAAFAQNHPEIVHLQNQDLMNETELFSQMQKEVNKKQSRMANKKSSAQNKMQLEAFFGKKVEEFQFQIIKYLQTPSVYKNFNYAYYMLNEWQINITSSKPVILLYAISNLSPLKKIILAQLLTPPFQHLFFQGFLKK